MSDFEREVQSIPMLDAMRNEVIKAQEGHCARYDLIENLDKCNKHVCLLSYQIEKIDDVLATMDSTDSDKTAARMMDLVDRYGSYDHVKEKRETLINQKKIWKELQLQFEEMVSNDTVFNKNICFSNIRELLKHNHDVKIGQIEKEAGVRLGYMSRLEKEGNTAEPSIRFIITAAKLLNVSLDTLVTINISSLTPHEEYINKFFDKLKADTIADKLDWNKETALHLNNLETDINGDTSHNLFSYQTFSVPGETGYPEEVSAVVFRSKSFDCITRIKDDCFSLRLKNGTVLYLMNIENAVGRVNDPDGYAIEAWIYVPKDSSLSPLLTSKDKTPIASIVTVLYETVKEHMEHPRINKGAMYAIDAYMKDDFKDDEVDEDIPF